MPFDEYLELFNTTVICLVQSEIQMPQGFISSEYYPQIKVDKYPQFTKRITIDFTKEKPGKLNNPLFESAWKNIVEGRERSGDSSESSIDTEWHGYIIVKFLVRQYLIRTFFPKAAAWRKG